MKKVTDPALLQELEGGAPVAPLSTESTDAPAAATQGLTKVTDPAILKQLNAENNKPKGFFGRVGEDTEKRKLQAGEISAAILDNKQTPEESILQTGGLGAGVMLDIGSEAMTSVGGAISAMTPDKIKEALSAGVNELGSKIMETDIGKGAVEALQKGTEAYLKFKEANPRAARNIEAVINVGLLATPGRVKPTATGKSAFGAAGDVASDAVFTVPEKVGGAIKRGAEGLLPESDKAVMDAAIKKNVPVTVGTVYGGEIVPKLESFIAQAPIAGGSLRKKGVEIAEKGKGIVDEVADVMHSTPPVSSSGAGAVLRKGIKDAQDGIRAKTSADFERLLGKVPENQKIALPDAKKLYDDMVTEFADDPDILKTLQKGPFVMIAKENLTAKQAKNIRQRLESVAEGLPRYEAGKVRGISKALDSDIGKAIAENVPDGELLLKQANKKARLSYQLLDDMDAFIGNTSDEQLITRFIKLSQQPTRMSAKGADASLLRALNRRMPKEAMDKLASYQLRQMGLETAGKEGVEITFNPRSFVTEWKGMSPSAKNILFKNRLNKDQMEVLDGAAKFFDKSRSLPLNPSGTGAQNLELILTGGAGIATMNPLVLLAPYVAGKGLSSQRLASAINKLPRSITTNPLSQLTKDRIIAAATVAGVAKADIETIDNELTQAIEAQNAKQ